MEDFRIYIADLASYNNGILSGKWIDLPSDDLQGDLDAILDQGTADRKAAGVYDGVDSEEWAIHDYELPFTAGEYDDIFLINDKISTIENLSEQDQKKLKFLESQGESFSNALEKLDDVAIYEEMSYQDLAYDLVSESWEVPEHLENYIDYDRFARELELDYSEIDGDLFHNHY